jgi:hypothetical protein
MEWGCQISWGAKYTVTPDVLEVDLKTLRIDCIAIVSSMRQQNSMRL